MKKLIEKIEKAVEMKLVVVEALDSELIEDSAIYVDGYSVEKLNCEGQFYVTLNGEFVCCLACENVICEIVITDTEQIEDYYSSDADYIRSFSTHGVKGELYLNLEIRENGEEYATSELMESGSQAQEDFFEGIVEWLKENDIDIIWKIK